VTALVTSLAVALAPVAGVGQTGPDAGVALPLDAKARLGRARVCIAAVDYACAAAELAEARDSLGGASPALRAAVLRASAEVALATGQAQVAESFLKDLLADDPDFSVTGDEWQPAWREALERVRAAMPDRKPPHLEVEPAPACRAGEAVTIRVTAEDPSGVSGVRLHLGGRAARDVVLVTADGTRWSVLLPAEDVVPPGVTFWIEATDGKGNVARAGSFEEPLRVTVQPAAESRPLVKQWWLWTVVGVVAAGLGTGIYFLARHESGGGGDRGSVPVEVRWPYR